MFYLIRSLKTPAIMFLLISGQSPRADWQSFVYSKFGAYFTTNSFKYEGLENFDDIFLKVILKGLLFTPAHPCNRSEKSLLPNLTIFNVIFTLKVLGDFSNVLHFVISVNFLTEVNFFGLAHLDTRWSQGSENNFLLQGPCLKRKTRKNLFIKL